MKTNIKSLSAGLLAGLTLIALCGTAQADLVGKTATAYPGGGTTWVLDPNGHNPFYSSGNLATSGNFTARGPAGASGTATATVLAETFTITNGAGTLGLGSALAGTTNYVLTGISMLISGYDSTHALSLHIFDVTANLTGGVTASGASYNFTANGDLLGAGNGLLWTNATLSGAEQQVYFGLQNGPTTYGDQVVLAASHTYTLEIWIPTLASGAINWFKSSAAPQDTGGEAMAGTDARLNVARVTGSASGFYGSSQHGFALALYGSPTSATPSVNPSTNAVPQANYIVDDFNSFGYGPTNYYVGANDYNLGQITNVWGNWFGSAFSSLAWDSTSDANNNPNSGSLKILAEFNSGGQYVVFDGFNGITPPLNALTQGLTSFQCDVRFDPSSATTINSGTGVTNYGHMQFGMQINGSGQDFFGSLEIPAGTTNWVHVNIPINISNDANLIAINDAVVKIDGGWYGSNPLNGPSTLWVDNIKFVGPATVVLPPPPTLAMTLAKPALRIFAGSTVDTYDRAELASVDQNQSWIGGNAYPVSYSFKLLDYPANIGQTHVFLVPINTALPNSPYNNEYVEYQASNNLWMVINPAATGVTAMVQWKTNLPNANPNQTALTITNATAVGTWTLAFTSPNTGTLTAPGARPQPFTIADPTVAADFANPLVAYFGLQPNSAAGEGEYEDWASIMVTNVAGVNESEDFTTDTSIGGSGNWNINTLTTALNSSLQLATTNTPFWVNWTLPAVNYGLGTADNVLGSTVTPNPWMLPEYFNNYADGQNLPSMANQGSMTWVLVPDTCLPTVDGQPEYGQALAPDAFFKLINPALTQ